MNWITLGICGAVGAVLAIGALIYALTVTWCKTEPCYLIADDKLETTKDPTTIGDGQVGPQQL